MADELDKIKKIINGDQDNIKLETNYGMMGLNMDQTLNQIKDGTLTYALNAALENFDSSSVNYQNEQGNELCVTFPKEYVLIGTHFINEQSKHIFFITNPNTGDSEIGYMDNNDCIYHTLVSALCLNFNIDHPIHKVVHKITNCTTEIYWTDGFNPRRYLDINDIPYILRSGSPLCDPVYTDQLDCNQLKLQPNFNIPNLSIADVTTGGSLFAGVYQFAAQYSDAVGNPFTSYYSVTNPTPIADPQIATVNFNYVVGKSIVVAVDNLDSSGQFQYFNLAVIKTINAVTSVELIGTYFIDNTSLNITYTGQIVDNIRLSINDIFEKFPYYDVAEDLTAVQDVLVWDGLTSIDRINYQSIASQINLLWETYEIPPTENYANELNATNLRGYLRDEVYAFEIVFLLKNGKQTDGFHIPGRILTTQEQFLPEIPDTNNDFIGTPTRVDEQTGIGYSPYWKIYNTASVIGNAQGDDIGNATPYEYGNFAYWESTEEYPCNKDLWGDLAGQPIRHHKFPDVLVSPITQPVIIYNGTLAAQNNYVYPIGVRINTEQVGNLIGASNLTDDQKADIVGYKIVRGDRGTNKSIVAKGILRNVGKYEREGQDFYFPNYPYNDLNDDPFLNTSNNAWTDASEVWLVTCNDLDPILGYAEYSFGDPNTNKQRTQRIAKGETKEFCSTSRPQTTVGKCTIGPANYDVWYATGCLGCRGYRITWDDPFTTDNSIVNHRDDYLDGCGALSFNCNGCDTTYATVIQGSGISNDCSNSFWDSLCKCENGSIFGLQAIYLTTAVKQDKTQILPNVGRRSSISCTAPAPLPYNNNSDKYRQIFNSPETSFGQPFLGDILKLENVMYGKGYAHFVPVRSNAKYRLLTAEAQQDALDSSGKIAAYTTAFNPTAMWTAYQAYLQIYINGITRRNYAYSFNSTASYDYNAKITNSGNKQRTLDIKRYLIPGVQNVGDTYNINNYQRESSVYLRTKGSEDNNNPTALPFPSDSTEIASIGVTDKSRFTISSGSSCGTPAQEKDISVVSYYASLKNTFVNQWGQMYSYETIDTGFQKNVTSNTTATIFGGDTFISRFAFKTKLPFFIDNRVNAPDDSDIFYDEIGNIAYPKYWHSARSILENYKPTNSSEMINIISYKAHKFDCPNDPLPTTGSNRTFYDGYFYLFAYGIPNFYCESSYNTDLRQAFNNKEGDFWPHVSTGIPDDWVQEDYVSIANDNTYTYNVTFSKQNKENVFTHLPTDYNGNPCYTYYPFRAVYSDAQNTDADNRVNSWLTYRAISYFDFPQNYGSLISLDGIQNKAVLARFENKTLMYNNLLTIDTSNPQAAYVGNPNMFKGAPPIDFAETDLGYVGSQNKMLLKIPQGQITVDAKRGQVFLIQGTQVEDLSAFGSGMNRFFTDHLAFEILRYFPKVDTDNNFNGVGLHGVYDSKFDRVILTKLDYIPLSNDIKYDTTTRDFYIEEPLGNNVFNKLVVSLKDSDYFCNKSWTLSFNVNTKSWISFHSYIPNWYIAENNFFYSGINGCCDEFDFVAGSIVPTPSTTTTTSSSTSTSTTTSTTTIKDCTIEGELILTNCDIEGEGYIIPQPCQRPMNLQTFALIPGYIIIDPFSTVISTESQEDACNAISYLKSLTNNTTASVLNLLASAVSLTVGQTLYNTSTGTDCTVIADGWYFTANTIESEIVYNVVNGAIVQIVNCNPVTTTTTTTASNCFSFTIRKTSIGVVEVTYTNCSGVATNVNIGNPTPGGPTETTFCARNGSITVPPDVSLINNGPC